MLLTQTAFRFAAIVAACAVLLCCGPATAADSQPDSNGQGNAPPAKSAVSTQLDTPKTSLKPSLQPVRGTVTYAGTPVSGATVTLVGSKASNRLHTLTDSSGNFSFDKVPAGEWTLTAKAEGMFCRSKPIAVGAEAPPPYAFAMETVESSDVLRITGKRTLIHPENIGSTTNLDRKFLNDYKSGNSLRDVVYSTPGMGICPMTCPVPRGEVNSLNYMIDGVVLPEAPGVMAPGQFATPWSLQSVGVDIGGYQAEDGGGPLGAVVHMKSRSIPDKPVARWGGQLGGPLAGNLNYYVSTPLSLNPQSILNRLRVESAGAAVANTLGFTPPKTHFVRDTRLDMNYLTNVEFRATEKDTVRLSVGLNSTNMQLPTSGVTQACGFTQNMFTRQNYLILSYKHRFEKWLDEANLHYLNAFYSERVHSTNAFDPTAPSYGGGKLWSVSPQAKRLNFITGIQGDVSKTAFATHHLKAGILTELRPVNTSIQELYFNANPKVTTYTALAQRQSAYQKAYAASYQKAYAAAIAARRPKSAANTAASTAATAAANTAASAIPIIPYGAPISPFTGALMGAPQMQGDIGKFRGFRWLQSVYLQDSWKPTTGILKRLTLDAGVRTDIYYGVFGNTMTLAEAIAAVPGTPRFSIRPFQKQSVCDAQVSGRYGGAFLLNKDTVIRGAYSQIFSPPTVDSFVRPFSITSGTVNGIFNGSLRPLRATRGQLVDASIERQVGPRFACRTNLYYKKLSNYRFQMPVDNTLLMQRVNLPGLDDYGVEVRMDLKPSREGSGWSGFVSNTVTVARLTGNRRIIGGLYDIGTTSLMSLGKYAVPDRREVLQAALGYRAKSNLWAYSYLTCMTGTPDMRSLTLVGAHPARTPVVTLVGLNVGYDVPRKYCEKNRCIPSGITVRIQNIGNQILPISFGGQWQTTRYTVPLQVLVEMNWGYGASGTGSHT